MARKAGVVSEETKTRIFQAAVQEFYTDGYNKSSLRRICKNAQVTTGALYFFFENKDDLFEAVISQVTVPLKQKLAAHCASEQELLDPSYFKTVPDLAALRKQIDNEDEDLEVFNSVIRAYFRNQMIFDIVLQNQTHPAVAKFMEEITALTEAQVAKLFELIYCFYPQKESLDPFAVHWLARMQIESVLEMISGEFTEEEAVFHAKTALKILRGGFFNLL